MSSKTLRLYGVNKGVAALHKDELARLFSTFAKDDAIYPLIEPKDPLSSLVVDPFEKPFYEQGNDVFFVVRKPFVGNFQRIVGADKIRTLAFTPANENLKLEKIAAEAKTKLKAAATPVAVKQAAVFDKILYLPEADCASIVQLYGGHIQKVDLLPELHTITGTAYAYFAADTEGLAKVKDTVGNGNVRYFGLQKPASTLWEAALNADEQLHQDFADRGIIPRVPLFRIIEMRQNVSNLKVVDDAMVQGDLVLLNRMNASGHISPNVHFIASIAKIREVMTELAKLLAYPPVKIIPITDGAAISTLVEAEAKANAQFGGNSGVLTPHRPSMHSFQKAAAATMNHAGKTYRIMRP